MQVVKLRVLALTGRWLQVLAKHLQEIIEVDWKSWLAIMVLITAYFGLIWATGRKKDFVTGSWIVMGWGMVLLGWQFQRTLRTGAVNSCTVLNIRAPVKLCSS